MAEITKPPPLIENGHGWGTRIVTGDPVPDPLGVFLSDCDADKA